MKTRIKLEEFYETIDDEIDFVDIKPYSHNIISLVLKQISDKFGKNTANETIDHFDLESLGWKKLN